MCLWLALLLSIISLSLALSLSIALLSLHPRQPSYDLEEIRVKWWESWKDTKGEIGVTGTVPLPAYYLYADAELIIKADNPNGNIAMHYENTTFAISYQGVSLGVASVPPHVVAVKSGGNVIAEWKCTPCYVAHAGHYLQADEATGTVPLQVRMSVETRAEISGTLSPPYYYNTVYDVRVRPVLGQRQ